MHLLHALAPESNWFCNGAPYDTYFLPGAYTNLIDIVIYETMAATICGTPCNSYNAGVGVRSEQWLRPVDMHVLIIPRSCMCEVCCCVGGRLSVYACRDTCCYVGQRFGAEVGLLAVVILPA